jgi:hypothetical protein
MNDCLCLMLDELCDDPAPHWSPSLSRATSRQWIAIHSMTFVSIRWRAFSSLPAHEFLKLLAAAKDSSEDPDVSLIQQRSSSSRVPIDDRICCAWDIKTVHTRARSCYPLLEELLACFSTNFHQTCSNFT